MTKKVERPNARQVLMLAKAGRMPSNSASVVRQMKIAAAAI